MMKFLPAIATALLLVGCIAPGPSSFSPSELEQAASTAPHSSSSAVGSTGIAEGDEEDEADD